MEHVWFPRHRLPTTVVELGNPGQAVPFAKPPAQLPMGVPKMTSCTEVITSMSPHPTISSAFSGTVPHGLALAGEPSSSHELETTPCGVPTAASALVSPPLRLDSFRLTVIGAISTRSKPGKTALIPAMTLKRNVEIDAE